MWSTEILPTLAKVVEHPDVTEDLAEVLSTNAVEVEYRVGRGVNARDE